MGSLEVDRALALPDDAVGAALLQLPEDQWFERKSARISARDLATPLVAMANADGGVVVIGMHDGRIESVPPNRRNELRQAAMDFTEPSVRTTIDERVTLDESGAEAVILVIRVDPGEVLHLTQRGECYLRVGDESRKLSVAQQRELAYDRGAAHYEASPVPLDVADLDRDQLEAYTQSIGASSVEGMLDARDLTDRQGRLTVAAQLLFDDRPQREFPSAVIRVLKYGSDQRGVGASMSLEENGDRRLEGSLPQQITAAAATIEELLPKWRQLGPSGLFESRSRIPRDAWLEGLVNAVVHRSYSMMGDHIRVEIFPNRIEITSPGRFPGLVNPDKPLDIKRYARNPRIARVCSDMGITRELGEGIRRMFAEMRRRGLVDPIYQQSASTVTLTLLAADALPAELRERLTASALAVLDVLRLSDQPLGTGQIAELADITRMTATRALGLLQDEGLVTWQGASKKDPRATWSFGKL
ncbi:ATP-binding protein [Nigerium massiliense]|uniref:ATP-binding protein n=1 Tax=Nigerium massiliense TaxID=1522317 RepID=UPI000694347D|nr:ATP-binding protein [Nigerium massiliense]